MRALLCSAFLLPLLCVAQSTPKALLWRIEAKDTLTARPSYVLGTVHGKDVRAYAHIGPALQALAASSLLAGELDMNALQQQAPELGRSMLLPGGRTLADLYSKSRYKRVNKALTERFGAMMGLMVRIKPFYLVAALSETAEGNDSTQVLDQYLQEQARAAGIPVIGLERIDEQLAAVDRMPLEEQAEVLYAFVRKGGPGKNMDRLYDAYAAQDLDALMRLAGSDGMSPTVESALLLDRNRTMVQRMDSLLLLDGGCFFVVGAAHLPGADGVLAGMKTRGYTVRPVLDEALLPKQSPIAPR